MQTRGSKQARGSKKLVLAPPTPDQLCWAKVRSQQHRFARHVAGSPSRATPLLPTAVLHPHDPAPSRTPSRRFLVGSGGQQGYCHLLMMVLRSNRMNGWCCSWLTTLLPKSQPVCRSLMSTTAGSCRHVIQTRCELVSRGVGCRPRSG